MCWWVIAVFCHNWRVTLLFHNHKANYLCIRPSCGHENGSTLEPFRLHYSKKGSVYHTCISNIKVICFIGSILVDRKGLRPPTPPDKQFRLLVKIGGKGPLFFVIAYQNHIGPYYKVTSVKGTIQGLFGCSCSLSCNKKPVCVRKPLGFNTNG